MTEPDIAFTHWDDVLTALREGEAPQQSEVLAEVAAVFRNCEAITPDEANRPPRRTARLHLNFLTFQRAREQLSKLRPREHPSPRYPAVDLLRVCSR